ncbi:MAG: UbiD family decarboxylase [Firmicutes bacterium]|nr:UbiD family decarboxylase [Bacillota bacterium]
MAHLREVAYDDLRDWMRAVDELGELATVAGASWQEEIGMATELLQHSPGSPAVLFEDIPGYPSHYRILTNLVGGRRLHLSLGFPLHLSKLELSQAFHETLKTLKPMPVQWVTDGPVMEHVEQGEEVDVFQFPTPLWHPDDGGRYIGTGSASVTRDPDEGWTNLGTYRVMIHDRNHVGFYASPGKHGRVHRDKWLARGEPCPVAVVIGGDPLTFLISSLEAPYGVNEYELVGALRGRPTPVFKGIWTGLPLPANAEAILEGFVYPGQVLPEGPFGEWTGYYGSGERPEPVIEVKAIYRRRDPIMLGVPPQRPPDELIRFRAVTRSAVVKEALIQSGVPGVKGVWAHEVGGNRMLLVVAIEQRYPGHSRQAGHVAAMSHAGAYAGKYVVVVDDDIDPSDLEQVMWAVCTRSDPATSIDIIPRAWSTPLDPRIEPERKAKGDFTNSRAIIDATRPWEWRDQFPKVNAPSLAQVDEARRRFGYLLEGRTPSRV